MSEYISPRPWTCLFMFLCPHVGMPVFIWKLTQESENQRLTKLTVELDPPEDIEDGYHPSCGFGAMILFRL